ncbi:MAG: alpha-amylase family glycosyl hydrolase [Paludibacter sp.]|nr:alpha-amylase family glycosyl hydrolase [Paludibacter sp.]
MKQAINQVHTLKNNSGNTILSQTLRLCLCLSLCLSLSSFTKSPALVERLEPTSWWVGMQQTELQLMLYGTGIATADITIQYPGVTLLRKQLTDNPNYAFLYLNIAANTQPGKFSIIIKKGKKKQTLSYELKARRSGSAARESFTEADAVYLLMPDRFANGNTANDSVKAYFQGVNRLDPGKRHGGDIEGIISKVPYMADLGVTALWTTPLFDNNDTNYSYHHYGCSDYYKIDPRLGQNEDYLRLSDACHANGLKLIIDVVPNHCSSAHWWLKDLPAKDWFNVWPAYTSSNYRMTAWTDPHAAKADLHRLTNGWFAPNMPDFNLKNNLVYDYLRQVYVYWIEYANIDGMRVDTYPYNDIRVAANFIQSIRNEYPRMNVVGECWVKTPAEVAYFQSGNNNKDGFDSRLTSVMDFCLKDVLANSFNETDSWDGGLSRFYAHYAQDFVYPNTHLIMNFLDNHDIDRYATAVKRDKSKYKMGLAMLITARGYPQIYYGTEIMLDGIQGSYEGHRFDFPGGWPADSRNAFTAGGRSAEENEIFDYLKLLLNYRKNNPVLQSGKMKQFIPEDGIYVTFRYNADKTIMVIANNNATDKDVDLKRFDEMLTGKTQGTDIVTQKTYRLDQPINVAGKSVLIVEV